MTGEAVAGEKARPIQTLIWYPAVKGGTSLRYNDYLRLSATEEVFGRRPGGNVDAILMSLPPLAAWG